MLPAPMTARPSLRSIRLAAALACLCLVLLTAVALAAPGKDYGWPYFDGPEAYATDCNGEPPQAGLAAPIYAYDRSSETASVIGAGV